jgi:hypothetical protein
MLKRYRGAYILIITANTAIFSYIMFYMTWQCNQIYELSGGTATCGLNAGAYVIAIANSIVAAAAALLLIQGK